MNPTRAALPQWLADHAPAAPLAPAALQQVAREQIHAWGLPSVRDEEWRWTNLRALNQPAPLTSAAPAVSPLMALLPDALFIRFIGGKLSELPEHCPPGLHISRLSDAAPDARQAAFAPVAANANDALLALNTAHADDGLLIEIAPHTELSAPILIDWQDEAAAYAATRVLVRVGAHSRATVIETAQAADTAALWRNSVMVIEQAENSAFTHIGLGLDGAARRLTDRQFVRLPRDARFTSINLQFGGQLVRREIEVDIRDTGAHCNLFGLMMPRGKQVLDTHTRLTHGAAHTTSDERYQIIADDSARGIFKGRILVAQDAQKIQAYQNSRNLLLSPTAEIDTKPELEIYADDVKCSHGATIGRLNPEALYYLTSRGIPTARARALLIQGFAQEILDLLPLPALAEWLAERITQTLSQEIPAQEVPVQKVAGQEVPAQETPQ